MNRRRLYTLLSLFTTLSLLMALGLPRPLLVMAQETTPLSPDSISPAVAHADTPKTPWLWTRWNATQYALAEDDQSLWIGASGSVLRWDKASRTYRRYGIADGLPHLNVYAVAVDGNGNRWFGGDHGLSQLGADEQWHHYTAQNSGLHSNLITGIAVGADGTIWLDHGSPRGVSRRLVDGSWAWFPNLTTTVQSDSARIQQMLNANPLWTVSGDEIWRGYAVFKGGQWIDRTPPNVPMEPHTVVADATGHVWVLPAILEFGTVTTDIYEWTGTTWSIHQQDRRVTALAADTDGTIWLGWGYLCCAHANEMTGYSKLNRQGNTSGFASPVAALLPSTNGVWVIGPSLLVEPDGTWNVLPDLPVYSTVSSAVVDGSGLLWLHSQRLAPFSEASLQTLDDQGDPSFGNDQWAVGGSNFLLTALERTPEGDLWLAPYSIGKGRGYGPPMRFHQGNWIDHRGEGQPPVPDQVGAFDQYRFSDIFAQDEHHTWFAYDMVNYFGGTPVPWRGVLALDDGGTVADFSDDVWTNYPIETTGEGGTVAVDARGRLWFGDSSGLYQYQQNAWQPVELDWYNDYRVCDLSPTPDGALLVQAELYVATARCDYTKSVFVIQADGSRQLWRLQRLVQEQYQFVRSTIHHNRILTVAPDGAVWYLLDRYETEDGWLEEPNLFRRDAVGLTRFPLPFAANSVVNLEVDANNHVWLVAEDSLWRLSPPPSFDLSFQPKTWMQEIGQPHSIPLQVISREGFTGTVTLTVTGLPPGIIATLDRNEVMAGEEVSLALSTQDGVQPGRYKFHIDGASADLTARLSLTVELVADLNRGYLPMISR